MRTDKLNLTKEERDACMEVLLCAFVYPPGPHREKFIADNSTKFTRDQRLLLDHIIILSNRYRLAIIMSPADTMTNPANFIAWR